MGAIKVVGDLTLTSSAKTTCNVTPSAADTVTVDGTGPASGAATLNGHLSVNMTGDFSSAPTRYTLLHAAGGLGNTKFQTLSITYPTGLGWTPQITYDDDGGNVFLDRVYDLNP